MLKKRLITAAALLSLIICAIFFFTTAWFAVVLGIFLTIAAWEWGQLMQPDSAQQSTPLLPLALVAMMIPLWVLQNETWLLPTLAGVAVVGWCVVLVRLPRAEHARALHAYPKAIRFLVGAFLLAPPWLALVHLHAAPQFGPWHVLFLIGLVAVADSAAYFTGRAFGKNKLAPHISPGKTWEGVYGAMAATAIYGTVCGMGFGFRDVMLLEFVTLCVVTVMFSIVGDLFESLIKRQAGVKDSGRILPGHGGVLDRIDSLTSAAPVFTLGLWLLEST